MQRLINQLIPFFFIGIAIVAFTFGIMLLAYLFLFGAVIGFVIFGLNWLREKLFPTKTKTIIKPEKKTGRIIDSDDWKKL